MLLLHEIGLYWYKVWDNNLPFIWIPIGIDAYLSSYTLIYDNKNMDIYIILTSPGESELM